jgi:probable rRNA maturation factor
MKESIEIQVACSESLPVENEQIILWVNTTLRHLDKIGEITIRVVESEEIADLNQTYRKKDGPTNVLAFPSNLPAHIQAELDTPLLGDVIICPQILLEESQQLEKKLIDHWAHIVIHGVLHLLGFDHIKDRDAEIMQHYETQILAQFNIEDPYLILEE